MTVGRRKPNYTNKAYAKIAAPSRTSHSVCTMYLSCRRHSRELLKGITTPAVSDLTDPVWVPNRYRVYKGVR